MKKKWSQGNEVNENEKKTKEHKEEKGKKKQQKYLNLEWNRIPRNSNGIPGKLLNHLVFNDNLRVFSLSGNLVPRA